MATPAGGSRRSKRSPNAATTKTRAAKSSTTTPSKRKTSAAKTKTSKAKTPPTERRQPPQVANGMLLVSIFGAFGSRALVEMSAERAQALLGGPLGPAMAPARLIDATEKEIAALVKRAPELKDSAMTAAAVALAYEIENPYNSATSKSMCARELRETMSKLRELAPPAEEEDGIDELGRRREARLAAGGATA